jgi:hypothetical protein
LRLVLTVIGDKSDRTAVRCRISGMPPKSALTTRFEDLASALVAYMAGIYCEEVVVGLLIGHWRWLCGEDFLVECVQVGGIVLAFDGGRAR